MSDYNEPTGARLKRLREDRGLSQAELAELVGVKQQTIGKIETSQTQNSRHLPKIARALNVPLSTLDMEYLPDEIRKLGPGVSPEHFRYRHDNRGVDPNLIKLHALYRAPEDQMWLNDLAMGALRRIEPLWDAPSAYGLLIADDQASPVIGLGDAVLVNPEMPPLVGADCVFIKRDSSAEFPRTVLIRRLVAMSKDSWTVQRFNPNHEHELRRNEFTDAHRIMAIYRRP